MHWIDRIRRSCATSCDANVQLHRKSDDDGYMESIAPGAAICDADANIGETGVGVRACTVECMVPRAFVKEEQGARVTSPLAHGSGMLETVVSIVQKKTVTTDDEGRTTEWIGADRLDVPNPGKDSARLRRTEIIQ